MDPAAPSPASAVVDLSSPLITAPLLTPHLSQHNSSHLHFPHLTYLIFTSHITYHIFTSSYYHSKTHHSSVVNNLPFAWSLLGTRLPFAWQAQHTEPPGGAAARGRRWAAAAFRVAGAAHRTSWRNCGADRGRAARLPFALSYGRRSIQSLLEQLRRAWMLLGRGCLLCGRRSTQSLLELLSLLMAQIWRAGGFLLTYYSFFQQLYEH